MTSSRLDGAASATIASTSSAVICGLPPRLKHELRDLAARRLVRPAATMWTSAARASGAIDSPAARASASTRASSALESSA